MAGPGMIYLDPTSQFSALITDRFSSFRQKKTLTNFTITATTDEPKLWCHKVVLAVHSPYFEAMFTTDIGDASPDSVHYDEISSDIMKLILDYMYRERIGFSVDQLMDIITASDFLQIDFLLKRCINEVKALLTNDNVVDWLRFAGKHSILDIKAWCMETIGKNFAEISQQAAFITLTYTELHECLVDVLKCDVTPDDEVLRTVLRWVSDDADSRGKDLEELMQMVRLDHCSLIAISEALETYQTMIAAHVKVLAMLTKSVSQKVSPTSVAIPTEKALVIVGGTVLKNDYRTYEGNPHCWRLDRQAKKFTKLSTVPSGELAKDHSVCQTPDGFAITGGRNSDVCLLFFASTLSWRKKNMLRIRDCHASIYVRGMLYVLCGYASDAQCASVECLALNGGNWDSLPESPKATSSPKVAELIGKIYLLYAGETIQLLEFDVEKKTWIVKAPVPKVMHEGRGCIESTSMIAANDHLLVAGGYDKICLWYNPATDLWCEGQQQPINEHDSAALLQKDNNTVLLLGGIVYDNGYPGGTDAIEELNLADGTWAVTEYKMSMPDILYEHQAFMLDIPKQ